VSKDDSGKDFQNYLPHSLSGFGFHLFAGKVFAFVPRLDPMTRFFCNVF
jgi:hypothetical protein